MNISYPFQQYVLCVCVCEWLMLSWLSTQYRGAKRIYSPLIFSLVVSEGHTHPLSHTPFLHLFSFVCVCVIDYSVRFKASPLLSFTAGVFLNFNLTLTLRLLRDNTLNFFTFFGSHSVLQKISSLSQMRCKFFLLCVSGNTPRRVKLPHLDVPLDDPPFTEHKSADCWWKASSSNTISWFE